MKAFFPATLPFPLLHSDTTWEFREMISFRDESEADTVPAIVLELFASRRSERQGRLIDHDQSASMEKKKIDGYF